MTTSNESRLTVFPAAQELAPIQTLYDQGLYVQAWELSRVIGPLQTWRGAPGRVLAGRLAGHVGASRLSNILHLRGWLEHQDSPDALYYHVSAINSSRGPYPALELLQRYNHIAATGNTHIRASLLCMQAVLMAHLRDFDRADGYIKAAQEISPDDPWVWVEQAYIYETQDEYAAALQAAQTALRLTPWYRPAITSAAHYLRLLDRDAEAATLLEEGLKHIESASLAAHLLQIQIDQEQYAAAQTTLVLIEKLTPLRDKYYARWLASQHADIAYFCGDYPLAAQHARLAKNSFFDRLADRLEKPQVERQRVLLQVDFVRQHHMTCVPATLSAISQFWRVPVDHLDVAEAICFDGTPDYAGRDWAERNGWRVKEFSVTWDAATALIDRHIPFTLSTVEPGSAHMQAVIGYDSLRGTFLIRDPFQKYLGEFAADIFLQRYRAEGPRGMAMVRIEQADLLDGMALPDADLHDEYYNVQRALLRHDRELAVTIGKRMEQISPTHRLTIKVWRSIALYDGDEIRLLKCTNQLLEQFPDDVNLRQSKQQSLSQLDRREARLNYLKAECDGEKSHPLLFLSYANLLRDDARELPQVIHMLRRSLRRLPTSADVFYKMAHVYWDQHELERAFNLYRIAACLEITYEAYSESYFRAARYLQRTEEALAFLQQRYTRYGKKSVQPAITLFEALDALERGQEGLVILESALVLRPADPDLLLYCADLYGRTGKQGLAETMLARAEPVAKRTRWQQTAAAIADYNGQLHKALPLWQQVVENDPFNMRAVRAICRLLAETQSRQAAIDFALRMVERFPHHHELNKIYVGWLEQEAPAVIESALRKLIQINPVDAWAYRELAVSLTNQRRFDEAKQVLEQSEGLASNSIDYHNTKAFLLAQMQLTDNAKSACRDSIRLSVDNDYALSLLLKSCANIEQRKNELAFFHKELVRQVTFGDGLLMYQTEAQNVLDSQYLLATLREALQIRPDLWHAWVALARQLMALQLFEEALSTLLDAAKRFPLLPRVWLEMAKIYRFLGNQQEQKRALEQALAISPHWNTALQMLADIHQNDGDLEAARILLQRGVDHAPLDAVMHGWLADLLRKMNLHDAALQHLESAINIDPGYLWAWHVYVQIAKEHGKDNRPLGFATRLTLQRPSNAYTWVLLAKAQTHSADQQASLARALTIAPQLRIAHELRIDLLVGNEQLGEALSAVHDPIWNDLPPAEIRLKEARIYALQGNKDLAIQKLRTLLENEADYMGGWEQLADWYAESEQHAEYLTAARNLERLAPNDHFSMGYMGSALLLNGDRAACKQYLRRAISLEPSYTWGARKLLDLQLEDNELEDAEQTLKSLDMHMKGNLILLLHVQLAAKKVDLESARDYFRLLCAGPDLESWMISNATAALDNAEWGGELDKLFVEILTQPSCQAVVADIWGERCSELKRWKKSLGTLHKLMAGATPALRAAEHYIRYQGRIANNKSYRELRKFLKKYHPQLHADLGTWGQVSYAMTNCKRYKETIQWLHDWQVRNDNAPWIMQNLAISLHEVKRYKEGFQVSRQALLLPVDHSTPTHALLVAFDAALAGDSETLARIADEIREKEFGAYYQFLHALLNALESVLVPKNNAEHSGIKAAKLAIRRGVAIYPRYQQEVFLAYAHKRCLWKIAQTQNTFFPMTLWWWLRLL